MGIISKGHYDRQVGMLTEWTHFSQQRPCMCHITSNIFEDGVSFKIQKGV